MSKTTFKKNLLVITILTLIFMNFLNAQNSYLNDHTSGLPESKTIIKIIPFGDKLFLEEVDKSAVWTLVNLKDNTTNRFIGNQVNSHVFENPGRFELNYSHSTAKNDHECSHSQFPQKMIIDVSSVRMDFDFENINFSRKINVGSSCDDIVVSIPVKTTLAKGDAVKFIVPMLTVTGVGVNLVGHPIQEEKMITNGVQVLSYKLSGTVNKEAYLMFDFVDYNNQIQTYNHLEIIK
jgi:hypothetical protein